MNINPVSSDSASIVKTSQVTTPQILSTTTQQVAELGLTIPSNLAGKLEFFEERKNMTRKGGYLSEPQIDSMFERLPKPLSDSLGYYMTSEKISFETENSTHPKTVSPKNEVMEKILKNYQDKYGIPIELCEENDIQGRLKSLQASEKEELTGIIVYRELRQPLVVEPLLCHFIPGQNSEIVILDEAPNTTRPFKEGIMKACLNMQKTKIYVNKSTRQEGAFSTRTDAMCILRNALLHIRLKKEQNNFEKIADLLPTKEVSGQKDGKLYDITVPAEWDYTAQISNEQADAGKKLVVRDCFSKKRDRSNPRTIEQFRGEHKIQALFSYKITLLKPKELRNLEAFSTTKLPDDVVLTLSLSGTAKWMDIDWKEKSEINDYLITKGYKNLKKI
jgi:hypothetical protein